MKASSEHTVTVGDGVVTVKRKGSSALTLANILGCDSANGTDTIYLDRLVHRIGESELGEFAASGAISTILTRRIEKQ